MNVTRIEARRYHWLSQGLQSFLDSPHAAIEGRAQGPILNLADARAARNRQAGLELVSSGPQATIEVLRRLRDSSSEDAGSQGSLFPELPCIHESWQAAELSPRAAQERSLHLRLPHHHEVRASDVVLRRLHGVLAAAADRGPKDFAELLLSPGLGARTVAALALVAEVVHGAPARFSDPARYSFAHGGKDGHPFPVPLQVYDETIRVLRSAIDHARLGNDDRLHAIRRLDKESRTLERWSKGPGFAELVRAERLHSTQRDARTVQTANLGPAQRIFSSL